MIDVEMVPIRLFEALDFCERQTWYRFVAHEDLLNAHMERGLARHDVFDEAERPAKVFRGVPVAAPELGVQGVLDEVRIEGGELVITEVKAARLTRFVWPGIVLQLAIQRLALAEQVERGQWFGPPLPPQECWRLRAYFSSSRAYREVEWTAELADRVCAAIVRARVILALDTPPPPVADRRCGQCQLLTLCMPFDLERIKEALP